MSGPAPAYGNNNGIFFGANADYSGSANVGLPANILSSDGQLWIGQTALNAGGTHINVGKIASADGSIAVTYNSVLKTINLQGMSSATDLHVARYIVSGIASTGANYTTIASAYAAAVAAGGDQTVFIQPGTYTENITLSAGINITAFPCDASVTRTNNSGMVGNVIISGKLSASYNGTVNVSGIWLETNGDFAISMTGANTTNLVIERCTLIGVANTIISNTATNGGWICLNNCYADLQTTGITHFVLSGGQSFMDIYYTKLYNSGNSTTASTSASGSNIFSAYSYYGTPLTIAGLFDSSYDLMNQPLILNSSTGANGVRWGNINGGTSSALSVESSGTVCTLTDSIIGSSNTNAITGSGTLNYSNISFLGTSKLVNTSTVVALTTVKGAYNLALPSGNYTQIGTDEIIGATSTAARAITLMTSPSKGQKVTVKDVTGTANTYNITITPASGNIDGSSTYVISTAYGSVDLWYSGVQWFVQ